MDVTYWNIIQGSGTLLIGGIALYIARQQWKTNQRKLKLDLFEKRYAAYRSFSEFSRNASSPKVAQNGPLLVTEHFLKTMFATKFLFDEKLRDDVSKLHNEAIDYQDLFEDKTVAEHGGEEWSEIMRKLRISRKSMENISKDLEKEFEPYLDFSKIK